MAQVMSEMLARFETARQNLAKALEQGEVDGTASIIAAARELSDAFAQIVDADLIGNDDRIIRIEFLLKEIMSASDRDGLVCTMAEQAMADVKRALTGNQTINSVAS